MTAMGRKPTLADALLPVYLSSMTTFERATLGALLPLALASCQPEDRDILVAVRNGQLLADFPNNIWSLVGLQDRTYCIRRVEVFDQKKVLWSLNVLKDGPSYQSCLDVTMPLYLGKPVAGFVSKGRLRLGTDRAYGLRIDGIGNGQVDFVLMGKRITNITQPERVMQAPCDSHFNNCYGAFTEPVE